jgi:hypothetical protein
MNMAIHFVDVGLESAIFTYKHAILNHYSVEKVQPHVEQPGNHLSKDKKRTKAMATI